MLFQVKYPVKEIKRFHPGVLPLLHSLPTRLGFSIPAPVSIYLGDFLGLIYVREQVRLMRRFALGSDKKTSIIQS